MSRLALSLAVLFVLALPKCAAFGQGGWSESPDSQGALPADAYSTPWPRVAQTTPAAYPGGCETCTPGYRDITDCSAGASQPGYEAPITSPVGCDVDAVGYSACRPPSVWYFSASGLIMGRDKPGRVWTTYENNNNPNQLMSTDNADPDWEGGIEAHVGRQFACGAWAVDLGYWTIDDLTASSSQTHANYVSTPLLFNDLEFGVADPVQDYFDSAEEHRIARRNTIQNLEVNLIEGYAGCSSCCPWRCRKSLGVRYFQFDEDLSLSTLDQGGTWGGNGGADEVTLSESIENNLLGVQLGCQFERQCGCQATFFIAPKFGIYNNRIEQRFDLRRGDGVAAMPSAASGVIGTYPVNSSRDVVSFLTEVNLGYSYQPNCHWSLFGGYRVMAMTGMGLADSQIPQYIIDIPEIADIDYQDALVLHGAFFGVAYSR